MRSDVSLTIDIGSRQQPFFALVAARSCSGIGWHQAEYAEGYRVFNNPVRSKFNSSHGLFSRPMLVADAVRAEFCV